MGRGRSATAKMAAETRQPGSDKYYDTWDAALSIARREAIAIMRQDGNLEDRQGGNSEDIGAGAKALYNKLRRIAEDKIASTSGKTALTISVAPQASGQVAHLIRQAERNAAQALLNAPADNKTAAAHFMREMNAVEKIKELYGLSKNKGGYSMNDSGENADDKKKRQRAERL